MDEIDVSTGALLSPNRKFAAVLHDADQSLILGVSSYTAFVKRNQFKRAGHDTGQR
jgi:hypothetical protein